MKVLNKSLQIYRWPGNIRQLKNITEQISIIEKERLITADILQNYLPVNEEQMLPAIYKKDSSEEKSFSSEREILYQVLFDMKKDMTDLKKLVFDLMQKDGGSNDLQQKNAMLIRKLYEDQDVAQHQAYPPSNVNVAHVNAPHIQDTEEFVEESLSLVDKEMELIRKALKKHNGKRKHAANDLGISERTLYRKIKEYDIN